MIDILYTVMGTILVFAVIFCFVALIVLIGELIWKILRGVLPF